MILKIFSQKKIAKKLAFLTQNTLNYANFLSKHWIMRKTPFFRRKLAKIAENCDHNIDPRSDFASCGMEFCFKNRAQEPVCSFFLGSNRLLRKATELGRTVRPPASAFLSLTNRPEES
jgi:hypothetical protein